MWCLAEGWMQISMLSLGLHLPFWQLKPSGVDLNAFNMKFLRADVWKHYSRCINKLPNPDPRR